MKRLVGREPRTARYAEQIARFGSDGFDGAPLVNCQTRHAVQQGHRIYGRTPHLMPLPWGVFCGERPQWSEVSLEESWRAGPTREDGCAASHAREATTWAITPHFAFYYLDGGRIPHGRR